jgi:hypothetical protein
MAVDEQRLRVRRSIEEKLGVEEAAYLIEGRPTGGWDALVTKEYLDLRLEALEGKMRGSFHDETTRLIKWFVPTVFACSAALGGITGAVLGVVLVVVD